jgi:hypothetical protein
MNSTVKPPQRGVTAHARNIYETILRYEYMVAQLFRICNRNADIFYIYVTKYRANRSHSITFLFVFLSNPIKKIPLICCIVNR